MSSVKASTVQSAMKPRSLTPLLGRERGAVVEGIDLDAAAGEEDPEVVVLVGQGDLAVHVRAREIEERGLGRVAPR